jgi:PAS domain S-box-containing protein
MDKLDSEHKPEGVLDFASKAHQQSQEIGTQGKVQNDGDTQQWLELRWKRLTHWLRTSTFTPEWLPAPWNHAISGYIFAILIPLASIILTLLLKQIFLTFVFPGVLIIVAILVVAILWGAGPGLLATLWGTILFNLNVLSPQYSLNLNTFQDVFETCFLLVIGIIMSLVVSRIERARSEAVAAHLEIEKLELRTREALGALLAMTQVIGQGFENRDSTGDETQERTGFNSQEVARRMAELTRRFLGCQRLSISIIEPDTGIMRTLAVVGLSQEQEQRWWNEQQQQESRLADSPEQSIVQRLQANEVVLFDMTQPPWNSYPNPYAIRTMLIAPMSVRNLLVGLLSLDYGGAEHTYTSEELELAGAVANLVATIIERDQLLHRQTELLASNQQMTELIALAHDAIIVRTPASIVISWNQGAERLYGWTEQEAFGRDSHELLQTRFPYSREVTNNLLLLHGQWEGQLTHLRRDGTEVVVESRQVLLQGESGQPTAILEINRDITEREHMQREREETRATELALLEANRRMDEFLGIVSHELRTPLTTIKGNVQLARLRLRTSLQEIPANIDGLRSMLEEIQMMLERAERQTNVQNRMVSDLLDISRIEADKLELRLVPCDLAAIVLEIVEDQRSTTLKRAVYLEMPEGETALVIADPERIGQVLSNYLTNALKYSQEGRPVAVQLKKEENKVRVSVQDEGPGLTPEEQVQVWERFYQVEGIKRQRGSSVGLGLGLNICRAIVEQHQGETGVESIKGRGSTFWFTIPLSESDDQEEA